MEDLRINDVKIADIDSDTARNIIRLCKLGSKLNSEGTNLRIVNTEQIFQSCEEREADNFVITITLAV